MIIFTITKNAILRVIEPETDKPVKITSIKIFDAKRILRIGE